MESKVFVTIEREDIIASTGYASNTECPLAMAVKRTFPGSSVSVAPGVVSFWEELPYNMGKASVHYHYKRGWDMTNRDINGAFIGREDLIEAVKAGGPWEPETLTLERWKSTY